MESLSSIIKSYKVKEGKTMQTMFELINAMNALTKAMIKFVKDRPDITINEIIEEFNLPVKKSRGSKILLE